MWDWIRDVFDLDNRAAASRARENDLGYGSEHSAADREAADRRNAERRFALEDDRRHREKQSYDDDVSRRQDEHDRRVRDEEQRRRDDDVQRARDEQTDASATSKTVALMKKSSVAMMSNGAATTRPGSENSGGSWGSSG